MPNSPQRPFVPKSTPPQKRAPAPESEFRIARPFVHGQARSYPGAESVTAELAALASITDFLAADAPPAQSEITAAEAPAWEAPPAVSDFLATGAPFDYEAVEAGNDPYELPPIEHFTDTVAEAEMPTADEYEPPDDNPFGDFPLASRSDEHGWEDTDWQRYDWRSAAALGEAGDPAANTAWAQTDWGTSGAGAKDVRETAAQAIADALDGIARRIRDGDLVIPKAPASVPDPATIAATLAALLGVRR